MFSEIMFSETVFEQLLVFRTNCKRAYLMSFPSVIFLEGHITRDNSFLEGA